MRVILAQGPCFSALVRIHHVQRDAPDSAWSCGAAHVAGLQAISWHQHACPGYLSEVPALHGLDQLLHSPASATAAVINSALNPKP